MADPIRLDPTQVFNAVKDEVQLWRDLQIGSIRHFNTQQLPYLAEAPAMFHAAVWFGLGMDAVGKFLPGTAAARLVSRAAVPLALLDYGTRYFARAHAQAVAEQRQLLAGHAERFKHRLINGVIEGERGFYTDPAYGGPLIDKLNGLVAEDRFDDDEAGHRFIRRVLKDSGSVVTDSAQIAAQTRIAVEKVARVVEHIYRASKYGPATHKQLKVSNSKGPFTQDDFQVSNCRLTKDLLARMEPGERVGPLHAPPGLGRNVRGLRGHPPGDRFRYTLLDDKTLNEFLANAWRYESRHRDRPFEMCTATWIWQSNQPVNAGYLAATYRGSLQAVEQTYRSLRKQYVVS